MPQGEQNFITPQGNKIPLMYPQASPWGTLTILEKQNSLFPLWPVIKCLLVTHEPHPKVNPVCTCTSLWFLSTYKLLSLSETVLHTPSPPTLKTGLLSHNCLTYFTLLLAQLKSREAIAVSQTTTINKFITLSRCVVEKVSGKISFTRSHFWLKFANNIS